MGPAYLSVRQADAFNRLMSFYFIWFFLGVTLGSAALSLIDKASELVDKPLDTIRETGDCTRDRGGAR